MYDNLIGLRVFYYDYLGFQQQGVVVYAEPTSNPNVSFLYINDIEEGSNDNIHVLNLSDGSMINYCECRFSFDVIPYTEGDRETFNNII